MLRRFTVRLVFEEPPVTASRRCYRTDLTDAQWRILAPLIPAPKPGGRPAAHQRRELLNAMLYLAQGGCAWRLLPHDLPPWQTSTTTLAAGGWRAAGTHGPRIRMPSITGTTRIHPFGSGHERPE
jgi:Putative transposase of IS4/5 family (DUF4096)